MNNSTGDLHMKKVLFLIIVFSMVYIPPSFAQDYTQWELPEGAIARLGKGWINAMKYSPDGTVLAVATSIGIWLYDTETYQETALLARNNKGVAGLVFSPDGLTLASAERLGDITLWDVKARKPKKTGLYNSSIYHKLVFNFDSKTFAHARHNEIYLYDIVTGETKHTLKEHSDFITSIAFSPDGQTLVSGSEDKTIYLWDVDTGKHKQTLEGHPDEVTRVSFSPDGNTLISVSKDMTIYYWDISTGERKKTLADKGLITDQLDKPEKVERVSFSPDDNLLATIGFNNTIRLWDTNTGTLIQTFSSQDTDKEEKDYIKNIESVLFSPDNRTVVGLADYGKIRIWDVNTGERKSLSEYPSSVRKICFSPDGKTLATSIFGGIIHLWDVDTGRHKKTISSQSTDYYRTYEHDFKPFSPDGKKFVFGDSSGTVYLWDADTKQELSLSGMDYNSKESRSNTRALISPDSQTLASWQTQTEDMNIRLWDIASGKHKRNLRGHKSRVKTVIFSPDSSMIASWSSEGDTTILLWDVATGRHKQTLKGHTRMVEDVSFSPDGKTLASGGLDGTIRIWNAKTGKQGQTFMDKRSGNDLVVVTVVMFNADGNVLASGHKNGSIRLWNIETGESRQTLRTNQTLKGHADAVSSISFAPDGTTLASTSKDATARLWDLNTGEQIHALTGYDGTTWRVFFYPNGLPLATGFLYTHRSSGYGMNIRLWDLRTGQLKKTLIAHTLQVVNLGFSGNGNILTSINFDETILLWDLKPTINDLNTSEKTVENSLGDNQ